MAPVDLEFLPVELAHFRSLVLLELVPMVSLSHMLALLVLMAPVDLEFLPVESAHFRSLVLLELVPVVSLLHKLELVVQLVLLAELVFP